MRIERVLASVAVAAGAVAWVVYFREDLILSHYDAKAHLVVARRVIDNITPGWQQIGAVWLPLPHLIQVLPVQIDLFYRTGAFASAVSIACLGATTWAAARLVLLLTGSRPGAICAAALLVLNPNLLYLHATPMTEPLLVAATCLAVLWLSEWVARDGGPVPAKLAWALFAAAWVRYEAWPILGVACAAGGYAMWRRDHSIASAVRRMMPVLKWPTTAVLLFVVNSRITVGEWFVSGGFFVPDPTYEGQLWRTVVAIWWGTHRLSGYVIEVVALSTAVLFLVRGLTRDAGERLVPVALFAAAVLPLLAFYDGHPFRVRYMVPVVAACCVFAGLAVGVVGSRHAGRPARTRPRRPSYASWGLAALLVGSLLVESPPWEERAALLEEAQWDVPVSLNRRSVTRCLAADYGGEKVMASMGSLAHYMQELSREGFAIADFVHEGTGSIWEFALDTGPAVHAGWMLVEEVAEGGDVLARRIRNDANFTAGMARTCEGGGVALYKRVDVPRPTPVAGP